MSYETTQTLEVENYQNYQNNNKDILTKRIKWDNYLKGASYFIYSLFVSLLSLSFLFSNAQFVTFQFVDLINIFIGLFVVLSSMGIISWIYKGALKKLFTFNYYIVHLINASLLSIIVIIMAFPAFTYSINGTVTSIIEMAKTRSLIFGIGIIFWFILGGLALVINIYKIKGTFPISWFKMKLSLITLLFWPILSILSMISSSNVGMEYTFFVVQICIFVVALLYSSFAFVYVKSFKEPLLSDKTEQEIQKINLFRNISFLMIMIPSLSLVVLGITKAVPIWEIWSDSKIQTLSLISMIIDGLMLLTYIFLVLWTKRLVLKNKNNKLTSIDNSIMIDSISWLLFIKTIIISGLSKGVDVSTFVMLSSCFIAIFIINMTAILANVNFPNIKNTTSTIINVIAALMVMGMILFQSTFPKESSSNIFESSEIVILTLLPITIASSINLGIKLLSYTNIDKKTETNNSELNQNTKNNNKIGA